MKDDLRERLMAAKLKVTPQRLEVLKALEKLHDHPTAEKITEFVKKNNPNIAVGTIYKVLEVFVKTGMIRKVYTENNVLRYDAITGMHHHLYSSDSQRIEDYVDDNLNHLLKQYFRRNRIPGFDIEDLKLQISGRFLEGKKKK